MRNFILPLIVTLFIAACQNKKGGDINDNMNKVNYPSHSYTNVQIDTTTLKLNETDYLPVYSDIYHLDGTKRFLLTATISIRNITLHDSAYVLSANYNDSYGKLLRQFIERPILLKPLESIEFVIEDKEKKGGAGASFLVNWGGNKATTQLLIQSIMIGTAAQQGLSFTSEAKVIERKIKP